jgi:hypothetical protein
VDFGSTPLQTPVTKTFTVTNTGDAPLTITSTPTITGPNNLAFQVIGGPAPGTNVPVGGSVSFDVQLTGGFEGTKNAFMSFGTNDGDEAAVNLPITAFVSHFRTIDDGEPGYTETPGPASFGTFGGYRGDSRFANSSDLQGPASATWTFNNVTNGTYYAALTWNTAFSPSSFAQLVPVTVMDGAQLEFNGTINQQNQPGSYVDDGANWQFLVFFTVENGTVTITMNNVDVTQSGLLVLADGATIARVGGPGEIPPGNGEGGAAAFAAPSAGGGLRQDESSDAIDSALFNTAYLDDDLEDVVTILAEDTASDDSSGDVATGDDLPQDELELALADLLG